MNKLQEIRLQKKLSISDLAKISGITRQTIWRLETETDESANSKTLKALADALGVKITDFFAE